LPLKIKLKLPSASASASPPVDEDAGNDDMQLESEEEDEEDDDEVMPGSSKNRPMTARQAALAGGKGGIVELGKWRQTHPPRLWPRCSTETLETSTAGTSKRKKKDLNDVELALKKEEMARKRKNLSEKRLQDEQATPFLTFDPDTCW
jgi:Ino eighty subunit 2